MHFPAKPRHRRRRCCARDLPQSVPSARLVSGRRLLLHVALSHAANHCKDLLRKRSREKTESWEALVEAQGEQVQQLLTSTEDPKSVPADAELVERILSRLPPNYRLILTLREVQGLTYQERADTLACSVDAVKARLRRARQELQDTLRHFLGSRNV